MILNGPDFSIKEQWSHFLVAWCSAIHNYIESRTIIIDLYLIFLGIILFSPTKLDLIFNSRNKPRLGVVGVGGPVDVEFG